MAWALELLTDGLRRWTATGLWITVLRGDEETVDLWRGLGVPAERIQRLGPDDNFWSMGVPGPSGPTIGDLLRPRPVGRARRRAGGRQRALPRAVEPRLHAVPARRVATTRSSATCPAGTSTPGWAATAGDGPAGRRQPSRDRPGAARSLRAVREATGRDDEPACAPAGRRPRAHRGAAHRAGVRPGQRGARATSCAGCCAARSGACVCSASTAGARRSRTACPSDGGPRGGRARGDGRSGGRCARASGCSTANWRAAAVSAARRCSSCTTRTASRST